MAGRTLNVALPGPRTRFRLVGNFQVDNIHRMNPSMWPSDGAGRFRHSRCAPRRSGSRPGGIAGGAILLSLAIGLGTIVALEQPACAAKIVMRVQAGNPIDKEQHVEVKQNLPAGVRTNNILSLGGLDLGYDIKNDMYYVHRDLTLGPKQVMIFDVEMEDRWSIPDDDLKALRAHTRQMVGLLNDRPPYQTAAALEQGIDENLDQIVQLQKDNAIGPGVTALAHIRANASNLETLKRVKVDVGRIENLVIGSGQDPGGVLGVDQLGDKPERLLQAPAAYTKTAVIQITVENTSPTRRREGILIRQDLPAEIREQDVVDAGGLDLATDPERGVAYVHKQGLDLEPHSQKTFNVVIRDKWNINEPRIASLHATAEDLLKRITATARYASLEAAVRQLQTALDAVAQVKGPETVDAQYVAFYRNQSSELDEIETQMNRLVMALSQIGQTTRVGFPQKAPSARTTWLIIYIILGFLAVMSVIFYFRWYGRSRAEGLGGPAPGDQ